MKSSVLPGRRAIIAGVTCLLARGASATVFAGVDVLPSAPVAVFDNAGPEATEIEMSWAVLSGTTTTFITRFQAGIYADAGGNQAQSTTASATVAYELDFDVADAIGRNWRVDIRTSRVGARTSVDDGQGESAFSLGPVEGIVLGVFGGGSLSSGTLDLDAIPESRQSTSMDLSFNQADYASMSGSGNAYVRLFFDFTATAQTIVHGTGNLSQGDEAAIRLGLPSHLTSFTAGGYPGPAPGRNPEQDGHFVAAVLYDLGPIPEPGTAPLLGVGLTVVAIGRRRSRSSRCRTERSSSLQSSSRLSCRSAGPSPRRRTR